MTVQDSTAPAAGLALPVRVTLILLAAMCSIPFLPPYHLDPIPSFAGEWMAVALGLLACLSLLAMPHSWQPLRAPAIALVPLGLLVVVGIQVATGKAVYWQHHMLVGLYLLWAAMMTVLGSALRQQAGLPRVAAVVAWSLLAAGVASAVIVGFQLGGVDAPNWIMPRNGKGLFANIGQTNHLANLLGLALASLMYLAVTRRLPMLAVFHLAAVLLAALALTGSRSGFLYLAVLIVLSIFVRYRHPEGSGGRLLRGALMMTALFAIIQFVVPILLASNAPPMPADKVITAAADTSVRLKLLEVAWQAFVTSPILGVGFGQFAWNNFLLAEAVPHSLGRVNHAHNLFAQVLAESGLLGALMLVGGLVLWLFNARRAAWSSNERWWLMALLGVLFVHSMLEHPLWHAYFLGMAAFLLGLGEEKTREFRLGVGPVLGAVFVGFGVFSLLNIGQHYMRVESLYQMNRKQLAAKGLEEIPALHSKGLMAPYLDLVLVRILPDRPEFLRDKLALNTQVIRFIPDKREVYAQATLLALNGRLDEARAQLQLALARQPNEANRYAVRLLRAGNPATMPLLAMALEFDLKRRPVPGLEVKGGHASLRESRKSGVFPDAIRENAP